MSFELTQFQIKVKIHQFSVDISISLPFYKQLYKIKSNQFAKMVSTKIVSVCFGLFSVEQKEKQPANCVHKYFFFLRSFVSIISQSKLPSAYHLEQINISQNSFFGYFHQWKHTMSKPNFWRQKEINIISKHFKTRSFCCKVSVGNLWICSKLWQFFLYNIPVLLFCVHTKKKRKHR